jgi:hypothetical protein
MNPYARRLLAIVGWFTAAAVLSKLLSGDNTYAVLCGIATVMMMGYADHGTRKEGT